MPKDPMSSFGDLTAVCISDEYARDEKGTVLESILFLIMGLGASIATTYLLSLAGILL